MKMILRISSFIAVSVMMTVFLRCGTGGETTPKEEAAYREWMQTQARKQVAGLERTPGVAGQGSARRGDRTTDADPASGRDQKPYTPQTSHADPDYYADDAVVLQPGQIWRSEVAFPLTDAGGDRPDDAQVRVVRNEWSDRGVDVRIDEVATEPAETGWRARVRYSIALDRHAPVRFDEPSRQGDVVIAAGHEVYRVHLIHLENYEGLALRPVGR